MRLWNVRGTCIKSLYNSFLNVLPAGVIMINFSYFPYLRPFSSLQYIGKLGDLKYPTCTLVDKSMLMGCCGL